MSQFDKLLQRIKALDNNLRFDEIRKILEAFGYTMSGPSGGSSHKSFRKHGKPSLCIPQHNPVKKVYVIMTKEAIESEEQNEENS